MAKKDISISIPENVYLQARQGRGIYRNRPEPTERQDMVVTKEQLYTQVIDFSKRAFKVYALSHGCKMENLDLEWQRYSKILISVLNGKDYNLERIEKEYADKAKAAPKAKRSQKRTKSEPNLFYVPEERDKKTSKS